MGILRSGVQKTEKIVALEQGRDQAQIFQKTGRVPNDALPIITAAVQYAPPPEVTPDHPEGIRRRGINAPPGSWPQLVDALIYYERSSLSFERYELDIRIARAVDGDDAKAKKLEAELRFWRSLFSLFYQAFFGALPEAEMEANDAAAEAQLAAEEAQEREEAAAREQEIAERRARRAAEDAAAAATKLARAQRRANRVRLKQAAASNAAKPRMRVTIECPDGMDEEEFRRRLDSKPHGERVRGLLSYVKNQNFACGQGRRDGTFYACLWMIGLVTDDVEPDYSDEDTTLWMGMIEDEIRDYYRFVNIGWEKDSRIAQKVEREVEEWMTQAEEQLQAGGPGCSRRAFWQTEEAERAAAQGMPQRPSRGSFSGARASESIAGKSLVADAVRGARGGGKRDRRGAAR